MTGDDFIRGADGGQVHTGIPAKQKIDVRRYLIELQGSQRGVEEGIEECGDASRFHEGVIVEDSLFVGVWAPPDIEDLKTQRTRRKAAESAEKSL